MPKIEGRKTTRQVYPAEILEVSSFHDLTISHRLLLGRSCVVAEHRGRIVFLPNNNAELMTMAIEGGMDHPAASVQMKAMPEAGPVGFACPSCTNLIVGLGRL